MPEFTDQQLTAALLGAVCLALVALLGAAVCLLRLRKVRREYMVLRGDGPERDILTTVDKIMQKVKGMNARLDAFQARQEEQTAVSRFGVRRFDLVRYDAFRDMGGRMSFSAALLDDHGDGIVFTSINGRSETRTYAKSIKALDSDEPLTDEEREVVEGAAAGRGRGESRSISLR